MRRGLVVLAMGALIVAAAWNTWPKRHPPPAADDPVAVLSSPDSAGYQRAVVPRVFAFPADHGPHPDFRQEWWYYTGNLDAPDGRHFGYQLTFFRFALAPPSPPARASAWAADQLYLAHFTVTDAAGGQFFQWERSSRAALGLAGAAAQPFRVWIEDWSAAGGPGGPLPVRLRAAMPEAAIDLQLIAGKPLVLQGDRGLSRKGSALGNASYYYSYTRLPSQGTVRIGAESYAVNGTSWIDREWSTSALESTQAGWDWFSLQLDSGDELMFYRLRRRDGGIDPHSGGLWVDAAGTFRPLSSDEVEIAATDTWRSPASGIRYPARWRLRVPALRLELTLRPYLPDQEVRQRFRYWEGAVAASGQRGGRPLTGSGYVELVGYDGKDRKEIH